MLIMACRESKPTPEISPTQIQIAPAAAATPVPEGIPAQPADAILTEEKDLYMQAYKILFLIQMEANMLNDVAIKINSGELTGMNPFGEVLAEAMLVKAVDESIPIDNLHKTK